MTIYETQADRERERLVLERLTNALPDANSWDVMPTTFTADGYIANGTSMLRWVEVKGRSSTLGEWSTERLEVAKWHALSALESSTGIPVLVAYSYADSRVAVLRLDELLDVKTHVERWGRTDRGADERDPHYVFPSTALREVTL